MSDNTLYNLSFEALKPNNKLLADVYDTTLQGKLPTLSFDNQQIGEEAKWIKNGEDERNIPLALKQKHKNSRIHSNINLGINNYNSTKSKSITGLKRAIEIIPEIFPIGPPTESQSNYFVPRNIQTDSLQNYVNHLMEQTKKRPKPKELEKLPYEKAIKFGRYNF